MSEWFQAGGWGMFMVGIVGLGSVALAAGAAKRPTAEKLAALRALPSLIVVSALFSFGTNLWAVNVHLTSDAFLKAHGIDPAQLPFVGLLGLTEAGQPLTLAGFLAMIVVGLRAVAEIRHAKALDPAAA